MSSIKEFIIGMYMWVHSLFINRKDIDKWRDNID